MKKGHYSITGYKGAAVASGIKKGNALDLGLIYCENDATAAGLFTTNAVKAAPVLWSREQIRDGRLRAIIANSGNANACTGAIGMENARKTAEAVSRALGIDPRQVIVASTGVIGEQLDIALVDRAIPGLAGGLSVDGLPRVAEAIMTTDSFPKSATFQGAAGGSPYQILGLAKGAGMIMPHMATMLCFVLSDIRIEPSPLREALAWAVEHTFNRISVDGDTSTNDMAIIMANGKAGNTALSSDDYEMFKQGLATVMASLAQMIVRDGEGASKVVEILIKGATTKEEALQAARTVANSSLVKTAFFGQDPNWGRMMAALGRSGIVMSEQDVEIWIDHVKIVEGGLGIGAQAEKAAAKRMKNKNFSVTIHLNQGEQDERMMTCDLTHDYISINADYRT